MARRFAPLLPLLLACSTEPVGDDDDDNPLRPQPIPELFSVELDPQRVHVIREGDRLRVVGDPGAAQKDATRVLVTAIESGPLLEVEIAADRSFTAELVAPAGALADVLVVPINETAQGIPVRLRNTGTSTVLLAAPCLTGSVGLVTVGTLSSEEATRPTFTNRFTLNNACDHDVTVDTVALRGLEPGFGANAAAALPAELRLHQQLSVDVSYTLPSGQTPSTRYDFLRITTESADDSGGGILLRVVGPAR